MEIDTENIYKELMQPHYKALQKFYKAKYFYENVFRHRGFDSYDCDKDYLINDVATLGLGLEDVNKWENNLELVEKAFIEIKEKKITLSEIASVSLDMFIDAHYFNKVNVKSLKDLDFGGIYFLYQGENDENGLTKIGMSNANIGNRIQSMKTALPHKKIKGFCIRCDPDPFIGIQYIEGYEHYWQGKFKFRWSHNECYNINYYELLVILFIQITKRTMDKFYHFDLFSD